MKKFRIVACIECVIEAESEDKAHEVFQELDLGALDHETKLEKPGVGSLTGWDLRDTEPMQEQNENGDFE